MIYKNLEEAVKDLKLDRRHKWKLLGNNLVYPYFYTAPCSCDCSDGHGCNHRNGGCHECGFTGKRRNVVPIQAMDSDGNIIEVSLRT
jgi:CxxC motif-containing protein (DUF1111 family)